MNLSRAGLNSFLIRDSDGRFVAARTVSRSGFIDPTAGEALAFFHAVKFCKELDLSCIILEGDAQIIVNGVNSSNRN